MKTQMEADRSSMKDKTPAEREALFDQKKTELEQWAKDNGLTTDVLKQVMFGQGRMHGHGMGGMHAPDSDTNDDASGASQQ